MMSLKSALSLFLGTVLAGCAPSISVQPVFSLGDHIPSTPESEALGQANEDYSAILAGRLPIHAKEIGGALDGGTIIYMHPNYQLLALNRIARIAGIDGVIKGPVLRLSKTLAVDGYNEFSSLHFERDDGGKIGDGPAR